MNCLASLRWLNLHSETRIRVRYAGPEQHCVN